MRVGDLVESKISWKYLSPPDHIVIESYNDDLFDVNNKVVLHIGPGYHHGFGWFSCGITKSHPTEPGPFSERYFESIKEVTVQKRTKQKWKAWSVTISPVDLQIYIDNYSDLMSRYQCLFSHTNQLPFENESFDFIHYIDACRYEPLNLLNETENIQYLRINFLEMVKQQFGEVFRCLKSGGTIITTLTDNLRTSDSKIYLPNNPPWVFEEWKKFASQNMSRQGEIKMLDVWSKS